MSRYRRPARSHPFAWLIGRAVLIGVILFAGFGVFYLTRDKSPQPSTAKTPLEGRWTNTNPKPLLWERITVTGDGMTVKHPAGRGVESLEISLDKNSIVMFSSKGRAYMGTWSLSGNELTMNLDEWPEKLTFKRAD